MGTVSARVAPRSGRTSVEVSGEQVAIRVRAPAEGGRATEEARHALASALGVAPSAVALRSGARSRQKVFDVRGMSSEEALDRLRSG
jgi:uncharacterized protein YggU (UPF0235/DUF167 family)